MDNADLREILRPHIVGLSAATTNDCMADLCDNLGLPAPGPRELSKSRRMAFSFDALQDSALEPVAEKLLKRRSLSPAQRNQLQDAIWAKRSYPEIPKRFRRELSRVLESPLFGSADGFEKLLTSLWVIEGSDGLDAFFGRTPGSSLRSQIDRHVFRNPDDWDPEYLFGQLGAFEASDRRFGLFLEGLASADVLLDEPAQRLFVIAANGELKRCGVELRETGAIGGYPTFEVVSIASGFSRKPKNLIFASAVKPDLRLADAINNDIEIVMNADKVLVYDRTIGDGGLTWSHLQTWWGETQNIDDAAGAKKSLYKRLKSSLPSESPPQQFLFDAFHRCFSPSVPSLPALLPEVWMHWDPKTVKERGADALLRFRMDFLMLFPHGVRVVIEVDGKHHYSDSIGNADARLYAKMAKADRDLKLSGYQVFRFGAVELTDTPAGKAIVAEFFQALFDRHSVSYSGAGVAQFLNVDTTQSR